MRTLAFFSFLFFFFNVSSQAFASANSHNSVSVGGWQTIVDTQDPNVQKVAKFAVSEYAKQQGQSFELADVVAAQRQVVAGLKYRLLLVAKTPTGNVSKYGVLVDESLKGDLKLVAFEPVRPSASTNSSSKTKVGGWETIINLQDPEVRKVATFAVSEYGKQQGASFELVDVFAARRKVVAGVKYQLVLDVETPSKSVSKFGALVNQSLKGDLELVSFAQAN
ncbi:multicystatin-like [Curcuma longa]|uniref:multicystatin-like n=1 Tax=Curcuma longa TaxID=136217 RepID=UPI003D9EFCA2